jgi:hypothetical protein
MFIMGNKTNLIYTRPVSKDHFTYLKITLINSSNVLHMGVDSAVYKWRERPRKGQECVGDTQDPVNLT